VLRLPVPASKFEIVPEGRLITLHVILNEKVQAGYGLVFKGGQL
jgi:hypothetical protein